jgi:NADH-quinone oxidoreductase subunit F
MVIDAIAAGRRGAIAIDKHLRGDVSKVQMYDLKTKAISEAAKSEIEEIWEKQPRLSTPTLPVQKRKVSFDEVELAFSAKRARQEAKRCLRCDLEE